MASQGGSMGSTVMAGSQQAAMLNAQGMGGYSVSSLGGAVGSAASTLGGMAVGYVVGKMISGGYSALGKSGNTAVVAGTVIGAAIGGPIGAAIGGAIGGAVNRVFGRKLAGTGIEGSFGAGNFSGTNYEYYKGGTFRSDKTKRSDLDPQVDALLDTSFATLQTKTALMATVLGQSASAINAFTSSIKLDFKGLTDKQIEEKIGAVFDDMGNSMASLIPGLEAVTRFGESSSAALTRLYDSIFAVNGVIDTLNLQLFDVSLSGAAMASSLADAFGGMDKLQSATSAYYSAFYTEEQRIAESTQQLTQAMSNLGYALPASKEGFRDVVAGLNLTTAAGQQAFSALMGMAPMFAEVVEAAEDAVEEVTKAIEEMAKSLSNAMAELALAQGDMSTALQITRMLAIEGMTAQEVALYDTIESTKKYTQELESVREWLDQLALVIGTETERSLALRDASNDVTRAIMQQVYAQEDLAAAAEKAAQAQSEAIAVWKSSLEVSVSQGKTIKSFVESLSKTGGARNFNESAANYKTQLVLARGGDSDAYNTITDAAKEYLDALSSRAGSSQEMAVNIAKVKADLLNLTPVVDLNSNIEILKRIEGHTHATATSTDSLKLNGVKANFDLSQTIKFIANDTELPADLRKMITDKTQDFEMTLKTAFGSGVSKSISDLLSTGAAQYQTIVNAALGAVDGESQKLALIAAGDYVAIVSASLGIVDEDSRRLALTAAGDFVSTVTAALGSTDPIARALAFDAANTINTTVTAALGSTDPIARALAFDAANTINTTVTAALGSTDPSALQLATWQSNAIATVISAGLSNDSTTQALAGILSSTKTSKVTVDGGVIFNPDAAMQQALNDINRATTGSDGTTSALLTDAASYNTRLLSYQSAAVTEAKSASGYLSQLVSLANAKSLAEAKAEADAKAAAVVANRIAEVTAEGRKLAAQKETAINTFNSTYAATQAKAASLGVGLLNSSGAAASATYDANTGAPSGNIGGFSYSNFESVKQLLGYLDANGSAVRKIIDGTGGTVSSLNSSIEAQRQVIRDLGGVPAFAKGGVFTNSIISRPTLFAAGQMGESGPEAVMPLANINGSLGVRFAGGVDNAALVAEIKALRQEVQGLRAEARATAVNTNRTAKLIDRAMPDGDAFSTRIAA
jgi:hypothetical protein